MERGTNLKSRKVLGILSLLLIMLMAILFGDNRHHFSLGDYILTKIGINVWSNGTSGLRYTGVVAALVIVLGIVGLVRFHKDVHKNYGKFVIVFFVIAIYIYQPCYDSAYGFIKSHMNGFSSMEYIREESRINYEDDYGNITFDGQINLVNYSNKIKRFNIKIVPHQNGVGPALPKEITVCDKSNRPVEYIVEPNNKANLKAEFTLRQSDENLNCSGSESGFDIIVFNQKEEKKFLKAAYN